MDSLCKDSLEFIKNMSSLQRNRDDLSQTRLKLRVIDSSLCPFRFINMKYRLSSFVHSYLFSPWFIIVCFFFTISFSLQSYSAPLESSLI